MTRHMTTLELPALQGATIGFDKLFDELDRQFANSKSNGYPPYNLAEITENEWMISVAVAGFSQEDLDVNIDRNVLTIEGSAPSGDDSVNYLHKGIAGRSFRRQFTLADYVYVKDASLDNGILNVHLEREVPEELQPKSIKINTTHSGSIEDRS